MKLIKLFLTSLLFVGAIAHSASPQLIDIGVTGSKSNRLNVLFIGDGYTANEKSKFLSDAAVFKEALMDSPWGIYTNYFNFYALFSESVESGTSSYLGAQKNTPYQCGHFYSSIQRLVTCNSLITDTDKNRYLPETHLVVVIVNDDEYGGSGGYIAVANRTSPEIVAHEVGHTIVHLADEYPYAGGSSGEAPNVTQNINRNSLTWRQWVEPSTPLATPETNQYVDVVGAFEGAAYQYFGWYRPTYNSRMRSNGAPLGPVNSEQFVLAMYNIVSPIESVQPAAGNVTWQAGTSLSVLPLKPDTTNLDIEWWVNGVKTSETGTTFAGTSLPANGTSTVTVKVIDRTPLVRKDPDSLLSHSVSWTVQTNGGFSSSSKSSSVVSSSSKSSSSASSVKSSSSASSVTSSSSSSIGVVPSQCNWWGQIVPLCTVTTSGWGYENNAACVAVATCKSQPNPYGVIGTSSSSQVSSSSSKSSASVVSSSQASSAPQSSSSSSSTTGTVIALVEAENYNYMSGVLLENTNDIGGGQNVGWLDAGDWMSYGAINIPVSGAYMVEFRVASLNGGGSFAFERSGGAPVYTTVNIPKTGDWQKWVTVKATVNLTAGVQGFGIGVKSGGFNINWYRITKL